MNKVTYGVSFSIKYAEELGINWRRAFTAVITELPLSRARLMSYWDLIEANRGEYNFEYLDWQIAQAKAAGLKVTLAVGMRQPRYPECHIPGWAKQLQYAQRNEALYAFLDQVIRYYKDETCIESWQLENEALNRGIGQCTDYDRGRLRREYSLIKKLDPKRPIIMSTSDSFGLPLRQPRPDIVGFSIYLSQYRGNKYYFSKLPARWYALRKLCTRLILRRPVIIHELQAEPWGPRSTAQLPLVEQYKSMDATKLQQAITYAQSTGIAHIDLWGAEWWYWLKTQHDDNSCWDSVKQLLG